MPNLSEIAENKIRFFGTIAPLIHDYARSRGINCDLSDVYLSNIRARRGNHLYHIIREDLEHYGEALELLNSGRPQYDETTFELLREAMQKGKLILLEPGIGRSMVKVGEEIRRKLEPDPFQEQRDRQRLQYVDMERPTVNISRDPPARSALVNPVSRGRWNLANEFQKSLQRLAANAGVSLPDGKFYVPGLRWQYQKRKTILGRLADGLEILPAKIASTHMDMLRCAIADGEFTIEVDQGVQADIPDTVKGPTMIDRGCGPSLSREQRYKAYLKECEDSLATLKADLKAGKIQDIDKAERQIQHFEKSIQHTMSQLTASSSYSNPVPIRRSGSIPSATTQESLRRLVPVYKNASTQVSSTPSPPTTCTIPPHTIFPDSSPETIKSAMTHVLQGLATSSGLFIPSSDLIYGRPSPGSPLQWRYRLASRDLKTESNATIMRLASGKPPRSFEPKDLSALRSAIDEGTFTIASVAQPGSSSPTRETKIKTEDLVKQDDGIIYLDPAHGIADYINSPPDHTSYIKCESSEHENMQTSTLHKLLGEATVKAAFYQTRFEEIRAQFSALQETLTQERGEAQERQERQRLWVEEQDKRAKEAGDMARLVDEQRSQIRELQKAKSVVDHANTLAKQTIDALYVKEAKAETKIAELQNTKNAVDTEIDQLKKAFEEKDGELKNSEKRVDILEKHHNRETHAVKALRKRIEELEEECGKEKKEIKGMRKRMADMEEEREGMRKKIKMLAMDFN